VFCFGEVFDEVCTRDYRETRRNNVFVIIIIVILGRSSSTKFVFEVNKGSKGMSKED